jgi:hypothetical protein
MADQKDPFETQTDTGETWVGVRAGTHRKTGETVTDIIIQEKAPGGDHTHIGIDQAGNEAFRSDK